MIEPIHECAVLPERIPGVYAVRTHSGRHFGRHSHGTFGIGVLEGGAQRSASGRGTVDAFAGDLVATNPGEVHDGRPLGTPVRTWFTVYFDAEVLQAHGAKQADAARIRQPVLRDPALRAALRRLLGRMARDATQGDARLALEASLAETCARLLARHTTQPPAESAAAPSLLRVRDCLQSRLADPPSLQELAALAGVSRFALLRAFKQAFGVPPHAWLVQQRAEHARRLLARGLPPAKVAQAAGFADQSHLTRQFARQFGFTPGAWRRTA